MQQTGAAIGLAVLVGMLASSPARADMQVLESNIPHIKVGARMPGETLPELPTGGRVRVLLFPSHKTKIFEGPDAVMRSRPWGGTRRPQVEPEQAPAHRN